jgi:hypothetical protein
MDHCLLLERRPRLVGTRPSLSVQESLQAKTLLKGWSLPARDAIGYLLTVNY